MPAPITMPAPAGCLWLKDAAKKLGVQPSTLRKWRLERKGPASFKHAGRVLYRETALDDHLSACEAADSRSNPALNPLLRTPQPRLGRQHVAA